MTSIKSILIDIDATAADHPALEQAVSLAARCRSDLKIVDVLPWVPAGVRHFLTPDLENELVDHRRQRLKVIADNVRDVTVTTELLRGRPGTALVQEVLRAGHDLLMRSHGREAASGPRPFGAVDMELLRHCPCPVWLVGRQSPHQPRRILAAVHANPEDADEQELNETVLDWALTLQGFRQAQLTILQAWVPYGASLLRSRMRPDEYAEFVEAARRTEHDALLQCLEPFNERLAGVTVELVPGEPEEAIVRFVDSHGIDVVVMGTVARTGIAGLVMGNTAERVLQRLRGSVLAVKPAKFQTPVPKP